MPLTRAARALGCLVTSAMLAVGVIAIDASSDPHLAGGPDGGSVNSLAVVATRPVTLFASFWRGGVFKSVDGGSSWTPADLGLPDASVCRLSADPVRMTVVYAACLDEIFKTVDGGRSWVSLGLDVHKASPPLVAPSDPNVVYQWAQSTVLKSRDGGRRWTQAEVSGLPDDRGAELAVDPKDPLVLYAGTSLGLFKSRDGGAHWAPIGRGAPQIDFNVLALDPSRPDTMYAGTTFLGLFRSTTGGASWTSVSNGLPDEPIRGVRFGGSTREALYVSLGDKIFRSVDEGDHWTLITASLEGWIWDFEADPFSPATVYAGTSSGVFVSVDAGVHWVSVNRGASRMSVGGLVLHGDTPTLLAHGDVGIFSSADRGGSWRRVDRALVPDDLIMLESDGSGGAIARTKSGYYQRPRTQDSWTPVNAPQSAIMKGLWIAPGDRAAMYAATDDVLLTTRDGGRRWIVGRLPGGRVPGYLSIAPGTPAVAYASTVGILEPTHVWRTLDGGQTWDDVDTCSALMALSSASKPIFDPNDINTVYVVVQGVGIAGGDEVRKTDDGGRTWREVKLFMLSFSFTLVPTAPATLFAQIFDPDDYGRRILLKSVDRGENWTPTGAGLPRRQTITRIAFDPANLDHLFAGTDGRGVFRSRDGGATWEPTGSKH